MDAERWTRVKELFHEALALPRDQREDFLRVSAGGDEALREAVRSMLARQPGADGFLESPALQVEALAIAADLRRADSAGIAWAPPTLPANLQALEDASAVAAPPRRASARPPWWMLLIGALFLADSLLRSWCYQMGPQPFGFRAHVEGRQHVVTTVTAGGLAERAGMRTGDVLISRDNAAYESVSATAVTRPNLEVGRTYRFDVERDGRRFALAIRVGRRTALAGSYWQANVLWQVGTLALTATGLLIMLKRPRDRVALTGALALAALSVSLYLYNLPPGYAVAWRGIPFGLGAVLLVPNLGLALAGPIGLSFFLVFPRPLLKARWAWVVAWLPGLCMLPVYLYATILIVYWPAAAYAGLGPAWVRPAQSAVFTAYGLAMLAAIAASYLRLTDTHEKRRLRMLVAGGAAGTLPGLARFAVSVIAPRSALHGFLYTSWWPDLLIVTAFLLFPVSFAYAVLRHRLLGVRVIVRMGVQYALARGLVIALVPVLGLTLAADALIHGTQPLIQIVAARGWIYAALAGLAVVLHTQRHRMAAAIDRRFFRDQYDVRHLLRDVAGQARRAGSLESAAPAILSRIDAALHPTFAALLVRSSGETLFRTVASAPAGASLPAVRADAALMTRLRATELPVHTSGWYARREQEPPPDGRADPSIELAVPIVVSAERDEALLVFGPRHSEEPYSPEDVDSLVAIAASLALLLVRPPPEPEPVTSAFEECPRCGGCFDTGTGRCANENERLVPVGMRRTLAGRYRLDRRLGRGGMGQVYEATDTMLGRVVAVKVVREEWVHSVAATERFRREARAIASFDHPNVVTVYDYGVETGRRAFLVMELLHGDTLGDELRRRGRLNPAETVDVFRGVCSAVEAAHRQQIVHRDLKPENIFLVHAGGGREATVKILDFGVARPLVTNQDEGEADAPQTDVGVVVGTVGYMSPEQLLGERPDVSCDLWALAVVAYECLAGALPFPVTSRELWRHLVLAGRPTPLRDHVPRAPQAWQDFFDRCLSPARARRPASADDFLADLEAALGAAAEP